MNIKPPQSYKGEIPWEEMLGLEAKLCHEDRLWLFERHAVIKRSDGKLSLLSPLKRAQRKALSVIEAERKAGRPVRVIIGKSRKQGMSTYIEADMYAEVVKNEVDALVIANDLQLSAYIFDMTRRYHEWWDKAYDAAIPPVWKPGLYKGQTNKGEMRFQNHEGHILVTSAGSVYAGTGMTPSYIHASESSKWDRGAEVAVSLFQSISEKPGTTFILESTFNGYDGLFLPMWEEAWNNSRLEFEEKDGRFEPKFTVTNSRDWNGFIPLFISAIDDEELWENFRDQEERKQFVESLDVYERSLLDHMGALPEFLKRRRYYLKSKCRNDMGVLKQEYPVTPQEAVRASGRSRFSLDKLDAMPIERGKLVSLEYSTRWDKKILSNADSGSLLTVFRSPTRDHRYVLSVDTAEGKLDEHGRDPDNSVMHVYDCDAGMEQVAVYHGRVAPEGLVDPALMIAEWYNQAFVIIASNSSGYHVCIEFRQRYPNERLYHRDDYDPQKTRMKREIGFRTHVGNRESVLVSGLANAIEENQVVLHDERTVMECKRFVYKSGGGTAAEEGYHDDHVIAAALGVVGAKTYPNLLRIPENQEHLFQAYSKRKVEGRDSLTGY